MCYLDGTSVCFRNSTRNIWKDVAWSMQMILHFEKHLKRVRLERRSSSNPCCRFHLRIVERSSFGTFWGMLKSWGISSTTCWPRFRHTRLEKGALWVRERRPEELWLMSRLFQNPRFRKIIRERVYMPENNSLDISQMRPTRGYRMVIRAHPPLWICTHPWRQLEIRIKALV